jgi:hypothetical protein
VSTSLSGWGISTELPQGWEGRISLRATPTGTTHAEAAGAAPAARRTIRSLAVTAAPGSQGWPGEVPNPVVHLANFALPPGRGDFGSGATDRMTEANALIVLFEYGPESVGQPLFASKGIPCSLHPNHFRSNALQRQIPGQIGFQHFFTEAGRAFTLFVVLGSTRHAHALTTACNRTLTATRIDPR